ncbi:MAG TPA: nitroreductase family protein [Bryobacteraceae bacterium]
MSREIDKLAEALPGVHDLIRTRWSPRSFSEREVLNEDLKIVLDAARWAASCYNEQPWRFLVARKSDGEAYREMLSVLVPFNQEWAKSAPVLIVMAAKRTFSRNQEPNRYALHDAGAALAHLFLQGTALGLHAHGMGGVDFAKARTVLAIPDEYEIAAAAALGYLGAPEELPESMQAGELAKRSRKPLSEVAFGAHWGQPLAL